MPTLDILGFEVYTSPNIEEDFYLNMALRKIIYADDARLRQKAKRVTIWATSQGPGRRYLETMHAAHGSRPAASQIGLLQRLLVVQLPEDEAGPAKRQAFCFGQSRGG
jgi:peptide deformylase